MKLIYVILVVCLSSGIDGAGRGRVRYRGRQLPFAGQPDVTENPWAHEEIQKVERKQEARQSDPGMSAIEDLDDTVLVGEVEVPLPESPNEPRQFYPGWGTDASSVTEVPQPISLPPYQPPQQPSYPQPSYPQPQQPSYPQPQQPSYPQPQPPSYPPPQQPPQQPQQPPQQPQKPPQQPQKPPQQPQQPPQQPQKPPQPPQQPILPPGCLAARGQFPSQKSCANYLNCWDDVVIEQQCPNGLLFNDMTGLCDFEYNVNCGSRPGSTPKPPLAPGSKRCPDPNGRYRSAKNCSEFYVCLSGSPIKFSCPRGLVYNDEYSVCDYPYNVDCQGAATPKPEPLPRPEPPQTQPPQQPSTMPPQTARPPQTPKPQPTFPPGAYPQANWLARAVTETDPWHQRPVGSQAEVDANEQVLSNTSVDTVEQDPTESPTIQNPWDLMNSVPTELTKVPCENGTVHRLHDSCSSVVVCRNKRPHLVQCPQGHTYDRPSDSCRHFTIAKC